MRGCEYPRFWKQEVLSILKSLCHTRIQTMGLRIFHMVDSLSSPSLVYCLAFVACLTWRKHPGNSYTYPQVPKWHFAEACSFARSAELSYCFYFLLTNTQYSWLFRIVYRNMGISLLAPRSLDQAKHDRTRNILLGKSDARFKS